MNKDTKMIKVICAVIGILAVIASIGLVGGLELDRIGYMRCVKAEVICFVLIFVSVRLVIAMNNIEQGRNKKYVKHVK